MSLGLAWPHELRLVREGHGVAHARLGDLKARPELLAHGSRPRRRPAEEGRLVGRQQRRLLASWSRRGVRRRRNRHRNGIETVDVRRFKATKQAQAWISKPP